MASNVENVKPLKSSTKRDTHCFAPCCRSGYVSSRNSGNMLPLFSTPKDKSERKKWYEVRTERWWHAAPREDKALTGKSVLCELRFHEKNIVHHLENVVNGEVVKLAPDCHVLQRDALPTIFPNAPAHHSRELPKRRETRNSNGDLTSAHDVLASYNIEHQAAILQRGDSRLISYIAGYAARKCMKKIPCKLCFMFAPTDRPHEDDSMNSATEKG